MNREQTVERLRVWARRAQNEAQYADTRENRLKWQGQASALIGVASLLSDQTQLDDFAIWEHVVSDRAESLAAWNAAQDKPEINTYAGEMAGYDVALTALKDVDGVVWPRREPHAG